MAALGFVACNDDNDALTDKRVTHYATITLDGSDRIVLDKGTEYVEAGYYGEIQGEDMTDKIVVDSDLDTSETGVYSITYTLTNADGYSTVEERWIIVRDPGDPIPGFYYSTADSYRFAEGTTTAYGGVFEIFVYSDGDGAYFVDDLLAGWYCYRAGYGYGYAMQAFIDVEEDGTVNLLDSYVPGWGDSADAFEGTYDYDTNTFKYVLTYAGSYDFHVTMTK